MRKDYQPIENYGIVGDLHTVALVGMNGSIDFLCMPRFDSPTVFAALLDHENGGHFQIAPELDGARQRQLYLPDTNVLLSRFLSRDGVAEISDFMPIEEETHTHNLVRRAKTVRGEVRFRMVCQPRRIITSSGAMAKSSFSPRGPTARRCACAPRFRFGSKTGRPWLSSPCAPARAPPSSWRRRARASSPARALPTTSRARSKRRSTSGAAGSVARPTTGAGPTW